MLTVTQNLIVIAATVLGSLLLMAGLNRVWPWERRRVHNDLIGWQLSILATTFAVILGFMLYAVWSSFGEAELNVDLEANAVVDLYRLADALPETQRTQLQALARSYRECEAPSSTGLLLFSTRLSLSLVAISDIHRPFHGLVHVSDYAFRSAQQSIRVR